MKVASLLTIAGLGLAACSENVVTNPSITAPGEALLARSGGAGSARYVVVGLGGVLPADLAQRVAAAGGRTEKTYADIGVAVIRGNAAVAASIAGLAGVEAVARV